jgi:wyosine [tRNA(Phe)-imidazoG37] synthetase (radical SAM superfamily)
MPTFLFDKIIFGPVNSRRLGISLGINLLPNTQKLCNFNCIYCECGWNSHQKTIATLPKVEEVQQLLELRLQEMKEKNEKLDVITFAGNGEPSMHPGFAQIISGTIALRDRYFPKVKVAVLSNATLIHKPEIFDALNMVDLNILKIDSAFEETCRALNQPTGHFSINEIISDLQKFKGKLIIQTMFIRGNFKGALFDNTSQREISAWIDVLKKICPSHVMIYTIARDTPAEGIEKIPSAELDKIAVLVESVGISVSVSD